MKTTRRPLLLPIKHPSGLPAFARELERDMSAIERSPIRRVVPVTPTVTKHVTAVTQAPATGGTLFGANWTYNIGTNIWTPIPMAPDDIGAEFEARSVPGLSYYTYFHSGGNSIQYTLDAGISWLQTDITSGVSPYQLGMTPKPSFDKKLWATAYQPVFDGNPSIIISSANYGASWSGSLDAGGGINYNLQFMFMCPHPTDANKIAALFLDFSTSPQRFGFYVTDNGGSSWTLHDHVLNIDPAWNPGWTEVSAFYDPTLGPILNIEYANLFSGTIFDRLDFIQVDGTLVHRVNNWRALENRNYFDQFHSEGHTYWLWQFDTNIANAIYFDMVGGVVNEIHPTHWEGDGGYTTPSFLQDGHFYSLMQFTQEFWKDDSVALAPLPSATPPDNLRLLQ